MKLPEFFEENFKILMDADEYRDFIASFDGKRNYGIRVNTLKITPEDFSALIGKKLEPIPWIPEGYYYSEGESFGKLPAYHAGLYYIQEPSAMMPAQALCPQPGEKVLDLCAAPGGKTTALGSRMQNKGLIVANDISPKRVKALVKNVELMGLTNTFIVNESPEKLQQIYPEYFDRILLDVPCSGEGMFRKDREAVLSCSRFKSEECVAIQREIVKSAYEMLKPGGTMVYSTCTFNPQENEENIEFFIRNFELEVDKLEPTGGFEPSRREWTESKDLSLSGGLRLWPHKAAGEGHFVCRLIKKGSKKANEKIISELRYTTKEAEKAVQAFEEFARGNMNSFQHGTFHLRGSSLFRLPHYLNELPPIKWEKAGLYLGEYRKGRFEPSQSLVMASKTEDFKRIIRFDKNNHNIIRYLKGETLFYDGEKGFAAVCYEDFPLGWVKQDGQMLKNLYPKGWRMM
ncbi:MAG TPA: NOL1/NOP2/sun family putative RNA methylase [Clostridiaceae bacterium]|jgi:NOL1/NOP2/sun family putative RNA methylase|nr:NOL1/NOP2/sun family putative RNA methylase [Clostridiaceae bacterium]